MIYFCDHHGPYLRVQESELKILTMISSIMLLWRVENLNLWTSIYIGSRIIESAAYCNHILLVPLYLNSLHKTSVNWIIRLVLSLLCRPKVILLSGRHSTSSCMVHMARILFSMAWGWGTRTPSLFRTIPMVPPVYKTRTWTIKKNEHSIFFRF